MGTLLFPTFAADVVDVALLGDDCVPPGVVDVPGLLMVPPLFKARGLRRGVNGASE